MWSESPSRIRAQFRKMSASPLFAGGGRVLPLLEYLVDAVAHGTAQRISQGSIARAVFSRGERFDPKIDAIVRVEIGRLRNKLREYYATDGAADAIVIEIPKGRYVPAIKARSDSSAPSVIGGEPRKLDSLRYGWAYIANPETIGTPAERQVLIKRVFRAPRTALYEAWTRPDRLRQWYGAPHWELVVCELDMRVGGRCLLVTRGPDGTEAVQRCRIVELEPGERIVHFERWSGTEADEIRVAIRFGERGQESTLNVAALYPTRAAYEAFMASGLLAGIHATYDRLGELLEGGSAVGHDKPARVRRG